MRNSLDGGHVLAFRPRPYRAPEIVGYSSFGARLQLALSTSANYVHAVWPRS
jgi:hypothetical protein